MKIPYIVSPLMIADSYKLSHWQQFPLSVDLAYSNWTARSNRRESLGIRRFVFFGLQAFLRQVHEAFQEMFFDITEDEAAKNFTDLYCRFFRTDNCPTEQNVRDLHQLGYLPLTVWSLPEGTAVNHRVPMATFCSFNPLGGDPRFEWVEGFLETWLSAQTWLPATSATTAAKYRQVFEEFAELTSDDQWFVDFQGHDFSMRGHSSIFSGIASGAGHLTSFQGTDTILALPWIDYYYGEPKFSSKIVPGAGTSVPATEHLVMCAGGENDELATFLRIISDVHPTGVVSVVSDTWDLWELITQILPQLKPDIMARGPKDGIPGKVVIRPDSSPKTPLEIICGDPEEDAGTPANKGALQLLWEIFGGTVNSKGYKVLDSHIGLIYGEAINLTLQRKILQKMANKGFASTNLVLGIGSYTYQGVTRDSHGQAIKGTYVEKYGKPCPIFKDPKTDTSGKKSARGVLTVHGTPEDGYSYKEHPDLESALNEPNNLLRPVYIQGEFFNHQTFEDVRAEVKRHLQWV